MRLLRRASVIILLSLLLLFGGGGGLYLSPIDLAAAPYSYDLLTWEVSHLPDKWVHKLTSLLPWNSRSRAERLVEVQRYFEIGQEIRALEEELVAVQSMSSVSRGSPGSPDVSSRGDEIHDPLDRLEKLRSARSGIKARVEETIESELSTILAQQGLDWHLGLILPPVDLAFSNPPRVLVTSPRDRIERLDSRLLKPDMRVEEMGALEEEILRQVGLSALVEGIGGVATYPTLVTDDSSLQHAAITASHEWLHTYWFFRPLGWNFWSSAEMTTLNETAADLAGREIGLLVYQAITGEVVSEAPRSRPPPAAETVTPDESKPAGEGRFDFERDMRATRLRVDELLAQGHIEEAEAFMEDRRRLFVDNGFYIRKLNQAYFAFHGTYAASPASVSPIDGQVKQLRRTTRSVGEFVRTMSRFGSYRGFLDYLAADPSPLALEHDAASGPIPAGVS